MFKKLLFIPFLLFGTLQAVMPEYQLNPLQISQNEETGAHEIIVYPYLYLNESNKYIFNSGRMDVTSTENGIELVQRAANHKVIYLEITKDSKSSLTAKWGQKSGNWLIKNEDSRAVTILTKPTVLKGVQFKKSSSEVITDKTGQQALKIILT